MRLPWCLSSQRFDNQPCDGCPGILPLSGGEPAIANGKFPKAVVDDEICVWQLATLALDPEWLDLLAGVRIGIFILKVQRARGRKSGASGRAFPVEWKTNFHWAGNEECRTPSCKRRLSWRSRTCIWGAAAPLPPSW